MEIILGTLPVALLVAYSQLIAKWRLTDLGYVSQSTTLQEKIVSYCLLLLDPFIFSAFAAAMVASFAWILVVARFPLGFAFPLYQGMVFALVPALSWLLLGEQLTPPKIVSIFVILAGVVLGVAD